MPAGRPMGAEDAPLPAVVDAMVNVQESPAEAPAGTEAPAEGMPRAGYGLTAADPVERLDMILTNLDGRLVAQNDRLTALEPLTDDEWSGND